jgi:hypothetical protein
VRQGDNLSPTLFSLYINDLVNDIKYNSNGITCGETKVHCLLYADDLVMLAETEQDMQNMLNILNTWCKKWMMRANVSKTKIVHFRNQNDPQSQFNYMFDDMSIEVVDSYKYLGMVFHYSLNYDFTADVLAKSGGRALGAICSKFRNLKGLTFKTFKKMFDTGVAPILDYCSGVWGKNKCGKLDTIQNRALRFFLGVHKFAPTIAVTGDCGWISCTTRRHIEILRLWNRLININHSRLTYKIFMWDKSLCSKNWSKSVFEIMTMCNIVENFELHLPVSINYVRNSLCEQNRSEWRNELQEVSKLRSYCLFKDSYGCEPYLYKVVDRHHRSILAQFRCGILPLKVETGRYQNIPAELRLCVLCEENVVENEFHFMLQCSKYDNLRNDLYRHALAYFPEFNNVNDNEKIKLLMTDSLVKYTAEFLCKCYHVRQKALYSTSTR